MPEWITSSEAAALLKPGMNVYVQGAASEPSDLLGAIAKAEGAADGVHFIYVFLAGINRTDPAGLSEGASATCFFVSAHNRASVTAGKTKFLPLHYSRIFTYLRDAAPIDMALIQVAPPDENGRCSLGVSVDYAPCAMAKAGTVVAEINSTMPAPPGSPQACELGAPGCHPFHAAFTCHASCMPPACCCRCPWTCAMYTC